MRAARTDTTQREIAAEPIEFSIPAVPCSRNRLDQHWALRVREDQHWRGLVALWTQQRSIPGPVVITLTFYSLRPCDPDNLARTVLNAIKPRKTRIGKRMVFVSRGLIDDDDWRTVTELRLRSRKGEARTVVRIERADVACVGVTR